jgi:hypothetical protein
VSAGQCRFCRCTEDDPCRVPGGDTCSWFDKSCTVCTGPACITAYFAEQRRLMAEGSRSTRKRTPGQIHELMKEERNAKRRAARAKRKQQRGAA